MSDSVPLTRAHVILPFLQRFEDIKGPADSLLIKNGLDRNQLCISEYLVSSNKVHGFINDVAGRLNDLQLGAKIGIDWGQTDGPPFRDAKQNSSNLNELLVKIVTEFGSESAAGRYSLTVHSDFAVFQGGRTFKAAGNASQADATFSCFILSVIKNAATTNWDPSLVSITIAKNHLIPSWFVPGSSIVAGQPNRLSFRFPSTWLWCPLTFSSAADDTAGDNLVSIESELELCSAIRKNLRSNLREQKMSISTVSSSLGVSVRSVQRALNKAGTTFRKELEKARIDAAKSELVETNHTVSEIARVVGFSNSSSLARALRKQKNVSPLEYRKNEQPTNRCSQSGPLQ